jgi:hypothetical protein
MGAVIHFPRRRPGCDAGAAGSCCWLCLLRLHWRAAKREAEEKPWQQ